MHKYGKRSITIGKTKQKNKHKTTTNNNNKTPKTTQLLAIKKYQVAKYINWFLAFLQCLFCAVSFDRFVS